MKAREPEPMEQIDYGENYMARRTNSPEQKQDVTVKIDGGAIAIGIALLALGVTVAACLLLPQINAARSEAEVAKATKQLAVQAQSAQDRAWLAERNAMMAREEVATLKDIYAGKPRTDGH